jgi:hypothetical protein
MNTAVFSSARIQTTVVGSYPLPGWLAALPDAGSLGRALGRQDGDEDPAKTEEEQARYKTEAQSETETQPPGEPQCQTAQVFRGAKGAPNSCEIYVEQLRRQLQGDETRLYRKSFRPYFGDSSASSFRVGRFGGRFHLIVRVAGEITWVFHSIDVTAIYDLSSSIYDACHCE